MIRSAHPPAGRDWDAIDAAWDTLRVLLLGIPAAQESLKALRLMVHLARAQESWDARPPMGRADSAARPLTPVRRRGSLWGGGNGCASPCMPA